MDMVLSMTGNRLRMVKVGALLSFKLSYLLVSYLLGAGTLRGSSAMWPLSGIFLIGGMVRLCWGKGWSPCSKICCDQRWSWCRTWMTRARRWDPWWNRSFFRSRCLRQSCGRWRGYCRYYRSFMMKGLLGRILLEAHVLAEREEMLWGGVVERREVDLSGAGDGVQAKGWTHNDAINKIIKMMIGIQINRE